MGNREFIFTDCLLYPPRLVQSFSVVQLRLRVLRKNFRDLGCPFQRRHNASDKLGRTKRPEGNHQGGPTQTMSNPNRDGSTNLRGSCSGTVYTQHISRLSFANLPDESVVIEMQKG